MSFQVKGKVTEVYQTAQVTEKFKKREFVIEVQEGMYPEYIKFQLTQERCSALDAYKKGDEVLVSFNLRGRPYTKDNVTTYFTNLEAWKVENGAGQTAQQAAPAQARTASPAAPAAQNSAVGTTFTETDADELPF